MTRERDYTEIKFLLKKYRKKCNLPNCAGTTLFRPAPKAPAAKTGAEIGFTTGGLFACTLGMFLATSSNLLPPAPSPIPIPFKPVIYKANLYMLNSIDLQIDK